MGSHFGICRLCNAAVAATAHLYIYKIMCAACVTQLPFHVLDTYVLFLTNGQFCVEDTELSVKFIEDITKVIG